MRWQLVAAAPPLLALAQLKVCHVALDLGRTAKGFHASVGAALPVQPLWAAGCEGLTCKLQKALPQAQL